MRRVRVYDNGGGTFDRYTIVFLSRERFANDYYYSYVGAADNIGPQGFYQHGEFSKQEFNDLSHLGRVIPFSKLPAALQRAVNEER